MEWAEIQLPRVTQVHRVVISRDREGTYRDRQPIEVEVLISGDGHEWQSVAHPSYTAPPFAKAGLHFPVSALSERTWDGVVEYAFLRERETWDRLNADDYLSPLRQDRPAWPGGEPYWGRIARLDALSRTLVQFRELIERLTERGLDTTAERLEWLALRGQADDDPASATSEALYLKARQAKRRLFFRDPMLASLERVLFAKQHPLKPSHNYSDHFDSQFTPGGGIFVLEIPRDGQGRLNPERGVVRCLFDGSAGIVRHPISDFEARTVYFAYRPDAPEVAGWQMVLALVERGRGWQRTAEVDGRAVSRFRSGGVAGGSAGVHVHPLQGAVPVLATAGLCPPPHGSGWHQRATALPRQSERMASIDSARRSDPMDAVGVSG